MRYVSTPRAEEPLRVALVGSSLKLAGAEKQTVYMSRALLGAGVDARFYHLGEDGPYKAALCQMGMPFSEIYKPNQPLSMLIRLVGAFWGFRPQIVFAPQFGDLLQAGIAGRCCNALVLGGLRSDGFYELETNRGRSRWMLMLAHGLAANSHHAMQNLASRGANPRKMKLLPNVLDLGEFDARSALGLPFSLPSDRVIAVAVGSLQPCKRFDRFLQALALARRAAPALFGVIAGADRGSRQVLEQEANELGLTPDHLLFAGECDHVPALLARAGFLVLCSEYEGFPNVILEAMAAGLPVITARVGDAGRIVRQDQTGYVVEGGDVEALAARMVQLALSPETRRRLGTEGRNLVQEYNYETLPFGILSVFRNFAAENRRSDLVRILGQRLDASEKPFYCERPVMAELAA